MDKQFSINSTLSIPKEEKKKMSGDRLTREISSCLTRVPKEVVDIIFHCAREYKFLAEFKFKVKYYGLIKKYTTNIPDQLKNELAYSTRKTCELALIGVSDRTLRKLKSEREYIEYKSIMLGYDILLTAKKYVHYDTEFVSIMNNYIYAVEPDYNVSCYCYGTWLDKEANISCAWNEMPRLIYNDEKNVKSIWDEIDNQIIKKSKLTNYEKNLGLWNDD
jgi:hypothetical protein